MSGSALERRNDDLWNQQLKRGGLAMLKLEKLMEDFDLNGLVIREVRIQGPEHTGSGYRAIIKGRSEDGRPFVAFHDGTSIQEMMDGIVQRQSAGTLKWREDEPWTPKTSGKRGPAAQQPEG